MKKWFAVIGDPIAQSMSPAMHDQWLKENQIDGTDIPIHVSVDQLPTAIESLKQLGCRGWNVTVPHKTAIIPLLDQIDPMAEKMNAVNTVVVEENGELTGYNTDGVGFVRSLEERFGKRAQTQPVLIIGAGGAAKGIAHALHAAGYGPITFTNRTIERAEKIAVEIPNATTCTIVEAEQQVGNYGLLVQTTSVGMNFSTEGMPFNPEAVNNQAIVADIIYNPLQTVFLQQAEQAGAATLNGVGMFVHQGALAFEKWTGIQPDTEKMIAHITKTMEE